MNLKRRHSWALLMVLVFCLLFTGVRDATSEVVFGRRIPEFREVFVKLFRATAEQMSMEQLKTTAAQLSERERDAIGAFLGEEGLAAVMEGLPADKRKFLDEQYKAHGQPSPGDDFQKLFPRILPVTSNNLTREQLGRVLDQLTEEDIASQSFYLGEEGRARVFTEMTPDRTLEILNRTADWVLIETGKRAYESIRDYTCILYKQERLGGRLQDTEKILLKFREKPHSIYMKWLEGPWAGRELVYNEELLGRGRVRVRESGVLGLIPVTIPVESEIAKRGSNHVVTEIGLKYLLYMIEKDYRRAEPRGHLKQINHGYQELDGTKVFVTESILPRDRRLGYYCYRMIHYIDFIRSLEIRADVYNWNDELYESYYYTEIKINQGLTSRDFDPANPDYNLR